MSVIVKIALVTLAFGLIAFGARLTNVGAPPPKQVTSDQLATQPQTTWVSINGTVVDRKPSSNGMNLTVQSEQGFPVTVLLSDEARAGQVIMGERYKFTGEVMGTNAISVSTPGSVTALVSQIQRDIRIMRVYHEIAYETNSYGTHEVAAPGIPDGDFKLEIITNGARTIAIPAPEGM